jgi:hypothetical protein
LFDLQWFAAPPIGLIISAASEATAAETLVGVAVASLGIRRRRP